jgi:hypothetical protein
LVKPAPLLDRRDVEWVITLNRQTAPLDAWRLRGELHYYPATGHFLWAKPGKNRRPRVGCISTDRSGYQRHLIRVDRRLYKASRLAWLWMTGEWPQGEVDHENRDSLDNRWENLRDATHSQNQLNRKATHKGYKNNVSGINGVYRHSNGNRWVAELRGRYLGCFGTKAEAAAAVRAGGDHTVDDGYLAGQTDR